MEWAERFLSLIILWLLFTVVVRHLHAYVMCEEKQSCAQMTRFLTLKNSKMLSGMNVSKEASALVFAYLQ
jgi:hypothetical protein